MFLLHSTTSNVPCNVDVIARRDGRLIKYRLCLIELAILSSRMGGGGQPDLKEKNLPRVVFRILVPPCSEVEVSDRYRFDASESSVFANVTIEVNVIDDLANVDSTVEDIVFSSGFVMSSRDTMDERVFDAGELGHG